MTESKRPVLPSQKPKVYIQTKCDACQQPVQYPPPARENLIDQSQWTEPNISTVIGVQCWSCKVVFDVDLSGHKREKHFSKNSRRPTGTCDKPASVEYYDILNVAPIASAAEIKKSYYALAMRYHPDKNDGDVGAGEKFKLISEAYQILSDPVLRKRYNEYGKQMDSPDGGFVNPEDFFKQQFGGDRFVDIIGEISIAKDFKEAMTDDATANVNITAEQKAERDALVTEERNKARKDRVNKLAEKLINKLSILTESTDDDVSRKAFEAIIQIEAEDLKKENYGVDLLHAVGFTYSLRAMQYLGRTEMMGIPRYWHSMKEKSHILTETVSTVRSAISLQRSFTQLNAHEKNGISKEDRLVLEELAAQKGLNALWKGSKLEVESVLRDVCDQVLNEELADKKIVEKRAQALKIVGTVYQNIKRDEVIPVQAPPPIFTSNRIN